MSADFYKWNLRVSVGILCVLIFILLMLGGLKEDLKTKPADVLQEVQELKEKIDVSPNNNSNER